MKKNNEQKVCDDIKAYCEKKIKELGKDGGYYQKIIDTL